MKCTINSFIKLLVFLKTFKWVLDAAKCKSNLNVKQRKWGWTIKKHNINYAVKLPYTVKRHKNSVKIETVIPMAMTSP